MFEIKNLLLFAQNIKLKNSIIYLQLVLLISIQYRQTKIFTEFDNIYDSYSENYYIKTKQPQKS